MSNGWGLANEMRSVVPGKASYEGDESAQQADADSEEIVFSYTFTQQTRLIGTCKATLWMSCPDRDDFDVFVSIRKADRDGNVLQNINIPLEELGVTSTDEVDDNNILKYLGPTRILRASHRVLDPVPSKLQWPAHNHTWLDPVPAGEILEAD
jgi:hypothetical protein